MTSTEIKKLLNLSRKEKIKIVQTLWDDIVKDQGTEKIPKEHIKILNERIGRIKSGETGFKDWETIKKKYLDGKSI